MKISATFPVTFFCIIFLVTAGCMQPGPLQSTPGPATTPVIVEPTGGLSGPSSVVILHGPRLGLINASSAIVYWETGSPVPGEIQWGTAQNNYPCSWSMPRSMNYFKTLTYKIQAIHFERL